MPSPVGRTFQSSGRLESLPHKGEGGGGSQSRAKARIPTRHIISETPRRNSSTCFCLCSLQPSNLVPCGFVGQNGKRHRSETFQVMNLIEYFLSQLMPAV